MHDPEAFQSDYEEYQELMRELAETPRIGTPEMAKRATELEAMYIYQIEVQAIFADEPDELSCTCISECEGCDEDVCQNCDHYVSRRSVDLCDIVREHDEAEDWMSDVEADADTLASAGYGTDEDYGYYGGDE